MVIPFILHVTDSIVCRGMRKSNEMLIYFINTFRKHLEKNPGDAGDDNNFISVSPRIRRARLFEA